MFNNAVSKAIPYDIVMNNGKTIHLKWLYQIRRSYSRKKKIEVYNDALEDLNSQAKSLVSGIGTFCAGINGHNLAIRSSDISYVKIRRKFKH